MLHVPCVTPCDLPFIFHGRITCCPLGQVRPRRVSLRAYVSHFVGIYFRSLFAQSARDIASRIRVPVDFFFFPRRATISSIARLPVLYPFYVRCSACLRAFLVIFYHSKLYFLIPLSAPARRWLPRCITRIKQGVITGSSEILSQIVPKSLELIIYMQIIKITSTSYSYYSSALTSLRLLRRLIRLIK